MVLEIDVREGELSGEAGGGETGKSGSVVGAEAVLAFEGRKDARFEDAREGLAGAALRPDGWERLGGAVSLVGPVEDLPVAQLAASAEAEAACADTSEGEGEHGEVASFEDARVGEGAGGNG